MSFNLAAVALIALAAFRISGSVCNADKLILILDKPFWTVGNLKGWIRIPFFNNRFENLIAFFSEPIRTGMI